MGKFERAAADPIRLSKPGEVTCPDCLAHAPGGVAGCRALFGELQIRNQRIGDLNLLRMCVDAYCLQHPEPYMHSRKSQTAHLVSMCWLLEYGASPAVWQAIHARLTVSTAQPKLSTPAKRGLVNLGNVLSVTDLQAYRDTVEKWARCAWEAWAEHHATVRHWIEGSLTKVDKPLSLKR